MDAQREVAGIASTQATVRYTGKTSGATLDLNMLTWTLPAHGNFVVSDPSLVVVSTPAASTPTTTPTAPAPAAPVPTPAPTTTAPTPTAPAPTAPVSPTLPAPTSVPAPAGYHLVWSDDFASIDRGKWNVRNNSWANNEESIVTLAT